MDGTGHFTQALRIAGKAGNVYEVAYAVFCSGATLVRNGHPNDALKLFQLGQFHLRQSRPGKSTPTTPHTDNPRLPTVTAWLNLNSATAYALMGDPDQTTHYLAQAHDEWELRDTFARAGMDRATAGIHLDLGQLDTAEQFAATSGGGGDPERPVEPGYSQWDLCREFAAQRVYVHRRSAGGGL